MKFVVALLLLPVVLGVSVRRAVPDGPWELGIKSNYPQYLFGMVEANNGSFWYGKTPSPYCPAEVEGLDCSEYPGTRTVFVDGGEGTVYLDVAVPGGQQGKE